jgi:hypothetical protein
MAQTAHKIVRNEFPWGVIEWLAGAEVGNAKEISLARMSLPPGKGTDVHIHGNCEEAVYVVRGRVECTTNGESVTLDAGERSRPRSCCRTPRRRANSPSRSLEPAARGPAAPVKPACAGLRAARRPGKLWPLQ